ncbi:MAG: ThaI family type II restriction endonuclease [Candidatus Poribacteria bacterium]|nr:ThaI family type II restriction endonuclease [Candidatus Poribacteria bacterium]
MNPCIANLLKDDIKVTRFVKNLPIAFEIVANEMPKGNPAIGILREHVIIGYFISEFGQNKIRVPEEGNKREFDVEVCGEPLSIKTITGNSLVKILWTADQTIVNEEIAYRYHPETDMFLITIHWGKTQNSVFYIPKHVQSETYNQLGAAHYLRVASNTNHRGITIASKAMKTLKCHSDTLSCVVGWYKRGLHSSPYERWENYWAQIQ